jgi:hypothetical protein
LNPSSCVGDVGIVRKISIYVIHLLVE